MSKRIEQYFDKYLNGVSHVTLNPGGPGCIRIHLVPPKSPVKDPSVVFLNGMDIIPLNHSWAILLNCLIREINPYHGHEITEKDYISIVDKAVSNAKKVFPLTRRNKLQKDLSTIMTVITEIAYGQKPSMDVGQLSIGEYADKMKAPHRMDFMVTAMTKDGKWHCNQKCVHCYAAGQHEAEVTELDTEHCIEVIKKLQTIGIPQITFTGGEPTMRKDLPELVKAASWFVTRLNTNGINMTPELCRQLALASLDSVQITFYSDNEDVHNTLVGAKMYSKTFEGIKNAIDAGLAVSINTPLCTLNKDYVSTLKCLHELGVEYVTCSALIMTGNACTEKSKSTQLSNEELLQILKDAVAYCNENQMEISFTSPGWIDEEEVLNLGLMAPSCGACLSNMAIAPNGDIVPCQSWLSDKPLGNILRDDWADVWESANCKEHRDYSAQLTGKCPLRNGN